MPVAQEQPPARFQQCCDGACPWLDAGQPAERANTGVDQVERTRRQYLVGGIDVRLDILDGQRASLGQCPCLGQRSLGIIQATNLGAKARQRQGVGADVALQVDRIKPVDVTEQWQVEAYGFGQVPVLLDQALDLVVL
ncbi:hypothetical protein D3C80_803510 [compost metagenome]